MQSATNTNIILNLWKQLTLSDITTRNTNLFVHLTELQKIINSVKICFGYGNTETPCECSNAMLTVENGVQRIEAHANKTSTSNGGISHLQNVINDFWSTIRQFLGTFDVKNNVDVRT